MAISTKDYKLLWGRAAARCSVADCRIKLTEPEGAATYGNVCHIVAESPDGPRGQSILTKNERNSYSNLVLLCAHHHDVIDAIPTGPQTYPVEVLHRIKTEHELWVEDTLAPQSDAAQLAYARVVDDITTAMSLNSWTWFSDHAIRDILPLEAVDASAYLERRLIQTVWPGKFPELENAAQRTMNSFVRFVRHFETSCEPTVGGKHLQANLSYKRISPSPHYSYWAAARNIWSQLNCAYLSGAVVDLNDFASQVREHLNPRYFVEHGRFLVFDSMGYRGRGGPYLPERAWVDEDTATWEKAQSELGSPSM